VGKCRKNTKQQDGGCSNQGSSSSSSSSSSSRAAEYEGHDGYGFGEEERMEAEEMQHAIAASKLDHIAAGGQRCVASIKMLKFGANLLCVTCPSSDIA